MTGGLESGTTCVDMYIDITVKRKNIIIRKKKHVLVEYKVKPLSINYKRLLVDNTKLSAIVMTQDSQAYRTLTLT